MKIETDGDVREVSGGITRIQGATETKLRGFDTDTNAGRSVVVRHDHLSGDVHIIWRVDGQTFGVRI